MAVQQYELRYRGRDRGKSFGNAADAISAKTSFHTAGDVERGGYRCGKARRYRSDRIFPLWARAAAPCPERRARLAVCRGRVGNAGTGPGEMGHLDHGPEAVETSFICTAWYGHAAQEW